MNWFAEQHAVVTGGGSGIGAAIARAMSEAGTRVTLMGRNPGKLKDKAAELGTDFQVVDVTDRDQVATAFAAAAKQNGTVTILVNNAGVAEAAPFGKMDDELWDRLIAVNLTGVYNCTKAAITAMAEAGSGRVINIASTAGLTGYAYVSAYCAAKHGVVGLTRALALEYAKKGVTVNSVCPGFTNTQIIGQSIDKIVAATGRSRDEALAEMVKVNPQQRLIEPEEVAATVMWICQQESITGQSIAVAGGEVM
ncbi:MAG: SDR family oxidoreductase [Proteobacteria bacterium]|nr:SDR family oxidoreductase [Pseudomonadota bacterium]